MNRKPVTVCRSYPADEQMPAGCKAFLSPLCAASHGAVGGDPGPAGTRAGERVADPAEQDRQPDGHLDQMYIDRLARGLLAADLQRIYQKVKSDCDQLEKKQKELERQQESPIPQEDRAKELVQRFIDSVPTNRELLFSLIEWIALSKSKKIYIKFRLKQLDFDCFEANS